MIDCPECGEHAEEVETDFDDEEDAYRFVGDASGEVLYFDTFKLGTAEVRPCGHIVKVVHKKPEMRLKRPHSSFGSR